MMTDKDYWDREQFYAATRRKVGETGGNCVGVESAQAGAS